MHCAVTYESILLDLVRRFPQLQPLFDEHIREYEELLPHVLFGDLTRFLLTLGHWHGTDEGFVLQRRIVEFLDSAMSSSDPRVPELISVSFLENIPEGGREADQLRSVLGPELLKELARKH